MAKAAVVPDKKRVKPKSKKRSSKVSALPRADLYIGLVGAAGTDLASVRDEIRAQMAVVGYVVEHIKVSDLLKEIIDPTPVKDEWERIKRLMAAGDAIRSCSTDGDGVAALVIAEIKRRRGENVTFKGSTVFLIDSLKNPKEVDLLDNIYGRNYYTLSVYLSKEERVKNVSNRIAKDRRQPLDKRHASLAIEIINDDEKSSGDHAQNVRDTFPKADYFINSRHALGEQVKRFVELVFGEPFTTPTTDEFYMFMARAAGYRSADLSRQVGAVIVDSCGSIASTGCNEVPYPGGGMYHEGRVGGPGDNRDFIDHFDPNYAEIQRSLIELISVLRAAKYLEDVEDDNQIVEALLQGQHKNLMSNARIRSLIEFGRIVHAEMHAICEAAAVGRSVRRGALYCTTFPCHVCARHIIAAGLSEVIYIEPYPKSLTAQLYPAEVKFAHEASQIAEHAPLAQVVFRPFHGTAPVFFQRAFRYRTRKNSYGAIATWEPTEAQPQGAALAVERPLLEASAVNSVASVIEKAKVAFAVAMEEI